MIRGNMQASKQRLQFLLKTLPLACLWLDEKGAIGAYNPAAAHLIGDLPGHLRDLLPIGVRGNLELMLAEIKKKNQVTFELALQRSDGEVFPSEVHGSYFLGEGDRGYQFLFRSLVDSQSVEAEITAAYQQLETLVQKRTEHLQEQLRLREKAEKDLRHHQALLVHSEKMAVLGQMAASLSHEISTPVAYVSSNLNTLKGYWDELKPQLQASEVVEDTGSVIQDCKEGLERVKAIIQDLKAFVRLERPEEEVADLNEGIEGTLRMAKMQMGAHCQLHQNLNHLPPIRCYAGQLNQVVLNLLVNASQAIQDKGDIFVETNFQGGAIEVRVRDTGPGIAADKLEQIFEPFYTSKKLGEGTGLGLAISKQIVDLHGGRLEVKSSIGEGTEFCIRIPTEGRLAHVQ